MHRVSQVCVFMCVYVCICVSLFLSPSLHSHVWHDAFACVTRQIHMCDTAHFNINMNTIQIRICVHRDRQGNIKKNWNILPKNRQFYFSGGTPSVSKNQLFSMGLPRQLVVDQKKRTIYEFVFKVQSTTLAILMGQKRGVGGQFLGRIWIHAFMCTHTSHTKYVHVRTIEICRVLHLCFWNKWNLTSFLSSCAC